MSEMSKPFLSLPSKHPLPLLSGQVRNFRLFVGVLLIFLLFSCNKKLAADKMPTTRIEFGHGGGFTGAVTTYFLLDNGRIYEDTTNNKAYLRINSIGKDEAAMLFAECDKLSTLRTDAPGNMYYFVTIKKGEQLPKRWIFGDPATATPQELEALYKRLIGYIPKK